MTGVTPVAGSNGGGPLVPRIDEGGAGHWLYPFPSLRESCFEPSEKTAIEAIFRPTQPRLTPVLGLSTYVIAKFIPGVSEGTNRPKQSQCGATVLQIASLPPVARNDGGDAGRWQ